MLKGTELGAAIALVIGATAFSFGQTANKKAPEPPAKPDDWAGSKECAAKDEKVMEDRDRRSVLAGGRCRKIFGAMTTAQNTTDISYRLNTLRMPRLRLKEDQFSIPS
jgi:hypothetical protein